MLLSPAGQEFPNGRQEPAVPPGWAEPAVVEDDCQVDCTRDELNEQSVVPVPETVHEETIGRCCEHVVVAGRI
jgi:hypothetical protein